MASGDAFALRALLLCRIASAFAPAYRPWLLIRSFFPLSNRSIETQV